MAGRALRSRDLTAFADFCARLGAHEEPATFARAASEALTRLIDCERIIHVAYPSLWQPPEIVNTRAGPRDAEHFAYLAEHSHEHPLAEVWRKETRPHPIYRLSEHVSMAAWRETDFYQLARAGGNEYSLIQAYRIGEEGLGSFALERLRLDFTERESSLLALAFSTYLALAVKLGAGAVERAHRRLLESHLAGLAEASVQVDRQGRIQSASAAGRRWLEALGGVNGCLPAPLTNWWRLCATTAADAPLPVHTISLGRAGTLSATCVRRPRDPQGGLIRLTSEDSPAAACERFRGELRLSAREAECLCWLQRGRTNSEISRLLGIGVRTVENYVLRLYAKLGVNSRLEAARRADAIR